MKIHQGDDESFKSLLRNNAMHKIVVKSVDEEHDFDKDVDIICDDCMDIMDCTESSESSDSMDSVCDNENDDDCI